MEIVLALAAALLFSLGSVLCTLVLGRPWFDAPSLPKIVDRVAHADPPRLSALRAGVPASLDSVVAKALAKREGDATRGKKVWDERFAG